MNTWGRDEFNNDIRSAEVFVGFYDSAIDMLTAKAPELSNIMASALRVVDMGCGVGASILLSQKISPNAEILSVDNQSQPLQEIIKRVGDRFIEHFPLSFDKFLKKRMMADIYLFCKSSHALTSEDVEQLSQCLNPDGMVLLLGGEDGLPSNWNDYFETIAYDGGYPSGEYINAAYKRMTNRQ